MANPQIRVFPGPAEASRGVAEHFAELVGQAAVRGQTCSVACSGGETPRMLYQLLATEEFAAQVAWERVHLFQVDERCVPPDDARSNYRMMREALFDRVPTAQFHRLPAERPDREDAARDYADEIRRVLAPAGPWPRFDLILLGLGADGHTASLFPGTAALAERERWVTPNFVPQLSLWRITLTFPVLNAAAEVIFLVSGSNKAEVLREVLEGPAERFPAQAVQPHSGKLWWYIDESAAGCLRGQGRRPS